MSYAVIAIWIGKSQSYSIPYTIEHTFYSDAERTVPIPSLHRKQEATLASNDGAEATLRLFPLSIATRSSSEPSTIQFVVNNEDAANAMKASNYKGLYEKLVSAAKKALSADTIEIKFDQALADSHTTNIAPAPLIVAISSGKNKRSGSKSVTNKQPIKKRCLEPVAQKLDLTKFYTGDFDAWFEVQKQGVVSFASEIVLTVSKSDDRECTMTSPTDTSLNHTYRVRQCKPTEQPVLEIVYNACKWCPNLEIVRINDPLVPNGLNGGSWGKYLLDKSYTPPEWTSCSEGQWLWMMAAVGKRNVKFVYEPTTAHASHDPSLTDS
jgi:hypothetical protein